MLIYQVSISTALQFH